MQIDWPAFTPESAVIGGLLIGAAAIMFALLVGRVAGISGIIGGLMRPRRGDIAWRVAFIAGMLATPALYEFLGGRMSIEIDASSATLVAAGLLVGWGTRAGSGCTSGHGVCGLALRSPRSLAATLSFMAAGFL
ncbi:MAG TPA: YeeE/YedE family protein, partial [Usitatibacter sp.]